MSAHSERLIDLLPAAALGALDADELAELNAHLAIGCEECRGQLRSWNADLAELALSAPEVEVSSGLRSRILTAATAAAPPGARRGAGSRVLRTALPWAALVVVTLWALFRQASFDDQVRRLAADRDRAATHAAQLAEQLASVRGEAARMARALAVVAAPGVESIRLAGLGPDPQATGRTYLNRDSGRAMFYAFSLPRLEPDKTYELWFITTAGPVPAGTFEADTLGQGRVEVEHLAGGAAIVAWAVTIEPRPGVAKPTGAMVLKG